MIYIKKKSEPDSLRVERETPGADFDSLNKKELRKSLLEEQGYLCAYCMKRIRKAEDIKIEHYSARNTDNQMDYQNLLAVCTGGQTDNRERVQSDRFTCDSCKGNKKLILNPQKKADMETITYNMNGLIHSSDEKFQKEIDEILNLNDKHGYLISNRKAALNPLILKLHSLKPGQNARPILMKLEKYCNKVNDNGELPEYAGIMRWYVAKKIRQHS